MAKVYGFNDSKDKVEVLSKASTTAGMDEIKEQVQYYGNKIDDTTDDIKDDCSTIKTTTSDTKNLVTQARAEIAVIDGVVDEIKVDTTNIKNLVTQTKAQVAEVKSVVDTIDDNATDCKNISTQTKAKIEELQSVVNSMNTKVNSISDAITQLDAVVDTINSNLTELKADETTHYNALDAKLTRIIAKINA